MFSGNDWIFRKEFIEENDGEKGKLYRCKSIWFLEDLGSATKLDRRVTSTASVYFHRFFLFHSFATHDRFKVAVACLFLAAKVEESAIRIKDIALKYYEVRHAGIYPDSKFIAEFQKSIILIERLVLNTLNFELYVTQPNIAGKFKELKNYIPDEHKHSVLQTSINFVNDSYRSTLCLQHPPHHIAVAMLYLALVVLSVKPATRSNAYVEITWISLIEKEIEHLTLRNICFEILDLYELTADKATKIKDKNFIKDQIYNDLSGLEGNNQKEGVDDIAAIGSLSPSRLTDQETNDEPRYEDEADEFNIKRQPKVTVTIVRSATATNSEPTSFLPAPPSESPSNGSDSVYSTMSNAYPMNEYDYVQEDTPLPPPTDTPAEGGNSIYHSFLHEETNPSDTPSFQDLPRLLARERSLSVSEREAPFESNKRPRLE